MSHRRNPVPGAGGPAGPPPARLMQPLPTQGTTMRSPGPGTATIGGSLRTVPSPPLMLTSVPALGGGTWEALAWAEYDEALLGEEAFWCRGHVSLRHRARGGVGSPGAEWELGVGAPERGGEAEDAMRREPPLAGLVEEAEREARTCRLAAVLLSERTRVGPAQVERAVRISAVLEVQRS